MRRKRASQNGMKSKTIRTGFLGDCLKEMILFIVIMVSLWASLILDSALPLFPGLIALLTLIYLDGKKKLKYELSEVKLWKLNESTSILLLIVIFFIPFKLLTGDWTVSETLTPPFFVAVSLVILSVFLASLIPRFLHNRAVQSGKFDNYKVTEKSSAHGLGTLFGPSEEEFESEFD